MSLLRTATLYVDPPVLTRRHYQQQISPGLYTSGVSNPADPQPSCTLLWSPSPESSQTYLLVSSLASNLSVWTSLATTNVPSTKKRGKGRECCEDVEEWKARGVIAVC